MNSLRHSVQNRFRCCITSFLISFTIAVPISSLAFDLPLKEGLSIAAFLADRSGAVDRIMNEAAENANYVVFNAAAQTSLLIESARLAVRDSSTEFGNVIDSSQRQTFDSIDIQVAMLTKAVSQNIEEARSMLQSLRQVPRDVLTWLGPTVTRSSPSVIAPLNQEKIPFTFEGFSLDRASPRLIFEDDEAERIDLKEQTVAFSLPARIFPAASERPTLVKGKLILIDQKCKFIFFCDETEKPFEVGVLVLPNRLAKVSISYDKRETKNIYSPDEYAEWFRVSTGSLVETQCATYNQAPHQPGYFIDPSSLTVADSSRLNGEHSFRGCLKT